MPASTVRFLKLLLFLLLPLLLVTGSVRLLITDQYLAFEYSKANFPADPFGFDQAQRLAYASANFRYAREGQSIATLAAQRLGDAPLYNERELKHMQDVQNVYQAAWLVWRLAVGIALLAALALAWRAETRPALAAAIQWGGLLTAGLVAVVGLLAVVAWRFWFVAFHQIFFAPGTWTFNYSDTLIRLFPEKFWFDAALTISGLSLLGGLLLALIGWRWQPQRQAARAAIQPSTSPS
jgi:integral membrane protein (TIGR01906 family)